MVLAERGEGRVKKKTMYLERIFTSGKRPKKVSNNKNMWSSLFPLKPFLFTRELVYVHISISSNTWNCYTVKNQEVRLFSTRQHSCLSVTYRETQKFKLLYFRNETCYGNGNLYKDSLFVYLQPSINKNW